MDGITTNVSAKATTESWLHDFAAALALRDESGTVRRSLTIGFDELQIAP